MINAILKAKHWQLFLLIFGLPFLIYPSLIQQISSSIQQFEAKGGGFAVGLVVGYLKYLMILGFLSMIAYWMWYWSVGVGLYDKIPEDVKMSNTTFKIFLWIPAVYIVVASLFVLSAVKEVVSVESGAPPPFNPIMLAVILPFHFFSMFCMFYSIYFVAKTIKTAQLRRKVTFNDFVAEFFLVWFFPIGIWILQPIINKLADQDDEDNFIETL